MTASSPRRVLHCLRAPVGGLFRHVRDLARGQAMRGLDVGVICDSETGDSATLAALAELEGIASLGVHRVAMNRSLGFRDMTAVRRIADICRPLDLDILHGHGAKGGAYARLLAGGLAAKAIYTPHGGSLHYGYFSPAGMIFLGLEFLLRDRADAFIFECRYSADTLAQKVGQPEGIVAVVYNGLGPADFATIDQDRAAYDFVFVGELRALKGIDILLEATSLIKAQRPIKVLIVGAGPDEAAVRAHAQGLGLDGVATFSPPIFPARAAFAQARCVVLPSRSEAFPYVVLEAAAAGMPLIASDVGGIPEIVGTELACLVPPEDPQSLATAMQAVLEDGAAAWARAQRLRVRMAEKFSIDAMVSGSLDVYGQVLSGSREIAAMPHAIKGSLRSGS